VPVSQPYSDRRPIEGRQIAAFVRAADLETIEVQWHALKETKRPNIERDAREMYTS
jgi:hypothetical protein